MTTLLYGQNRHFDKLVEDAAAQAPLVIPGNSASESWADLADKPDNYPVLFEDPEPLPPGMAAVYKPDDYRKLIAAADRVADVGHWGTADEIAFHEKQHMAAARLLGPHTTRFSVSFNWVSDLQVSYGSRLEIAGFSFPRWLNDYQAGRCRRRRPSVEADGLG